MKIRGTFIMNYHAVIQTVIICGTTKVNNMENTTEGIFPKINIQSTET